VALKNEHANANTVCLLALLLETEHQHSSLLGELFDSKDKLEEARNRIKLLVGTNKKPKALDKAVYS